MPVRKPIVHENETKRSYIEAYQALGVFFEHVNGTDVNGTDNVIAQECPYCGKDKFYVSQSTGQYHCKHCDESGNLTKFLTWKHKQLLEQTSPEAYAELRTRRGGVAPQTYRLHEWAYEPAPDDCWWIPFKRSNGNVVNVQRYYWNRPSPNKYNLPGLPISLYGFDRLMKDTDKKRIVYVCEGAPDAVALDYKIGATKRDRYLIVAAPGGFQKGWAEHFTGRKVRLLFDNDDAGRKHAERAAELLKDLAKDVGVLRWPSDIWNKEQGVPKDINDLVRLYPDIKLPGFIEKHSPKTEGRAKLDVEFNWTRRKDQEKAPDWIWPNHLQCNTYCSFSGQQASMKSTVARELIARYTTGRAMPTWTAGKDSDLSWLDPMMPAGKVILITAEDEREDAWRKLEVSGADLDRVMILNATTLDGNTLNMLQELKELKGLIREHNVRLVVVDGQNSVVGAPPIDTDQKARTFVTNPLHQFAQQERICLLGIRNEDSQGRALGAQSMADIGRCVMRSVPVGEDDDHNRYFELQFVKVTNVSPKLFLPIPFAVTEANGLPRIVWGEKMPKGNANAAIRKQAREKLSPKKYP